MNQERPRQLLMEPEVANLLRVDKVTLAHARKAGKPLVPWLRVGVRGIRYNPSDVEAYVLAQTNGLPEPRPKAKGGAS